MDFVLGHLKEFNFSFQLPQGTSAKPRVYASAHSIYLNQKFDSRSEQNGKALFYFTVKYKLFLNRQVINIFNNFETVIAAQEK